jgi:hypothetical protein
MNIIELFVFIIVDPSKKSTITTYSSTNLYSSIAFQIFITFILVNIE